MTAHAKNIALWAAWTFFWAFVLVVALLWPPLLSIALMVLLSGVMVTWPYEHLDRKARRLVKSLEQDLRRS